MSIENLYQRCRIKKRPDADASLLPGPARGVEAPVAFSHRRSVL
jgi:hypothetical protein